MSLYRFTYMKMEERDRLLKDQRKAETILSKDRRSTQHNRQEQV